MELQGKIFLELPSASGVSKLGNEWYKRTFVLETVDKYQRKAAFDVFNDTARGLQIKAGDLVTAHIDIESREYNGRWYTNVTAYKVEPVNEPQMPAQETMPTHEPEPLLPVSQPQSPQSPQSPQPPQPPQSNESDTDLPFGL